MSQIQAFQAITAKLFNSGSGFASGEDTASPRGTGFASLTARNWYGKVRMRSSYFRNPVMLKAGRGAGFGEILVLPTAWSNSPSSSGSRGKALSLEEFRLRGQQATMMRTALSEYRASVSDVLSDADPPPPVSDLQKLGGERVLNALGALARDTSARGRASLKLSRSAEEFSTEVGLSLLGHFVLNPHDHDEFLRILHADLKEWLSSGSIIKGNWGNLSVDGAGFLWLESSSLPEPDPSEDEPVEVSY